MFESVGELNEQQQGYVRKIIFKRGEYNSCE